MAVENAERDRVAVSELRPKRRLVSHLRSFVRQQPLGVVAAFILALLVVVAALAPFIAPYGPLEVHRGSAYTGPSSRFWFGTDQMARDVFSRVVYGARISLIVGFIAVGLGTGMGTIIGVISAYFGKLDIAIQRVVDTMMAFPGLIFLLVVITLLGPNIFNMMIAIGILIAPAESRIVRSAVLSVKQNVYVEAARAIGASNRRIILRHILPNVMAPIIVIASVMMGSAILLESSLSFLGFGAQPPQPSWGNMLQQGRTYMERAPWLAVVPGLAISFVVLSFNLFGDAIRDVLDPRLRGSRGV